MSWVDNPGDWLIYPFLLSGVVVGSVSSSQLQAILSLPCGHLHLRVVHLAGLMHPLLLHYPWISHRAQGRMSMTQGSWGLSQLELGVFQQFLGSLHVEWGDVVQAGVGALSFILMGSRSWAPFTSSGLSYRPKPWGTMEFSS